MATKRAADPKAELDRAERNAARGKVRRQVLMENQNGGAQSVGWTPSGTMVASNEEILVVVYTGKKQFNLTATGDAGAVLDLNGLQASTGGGKASTGSTNETGVIVTTITPRTPGAFELLVTEKVKTDDPAGTSFAAEYVVVGRTAGAFRIGAALVGDATPTYGTVTSGGSSVVAQVNGPYVPQPEVIIGWRPYLQPAFRVASGTAQRDLREAYYPRKRCLVNNLPCAGMYLGLGAVTPGTTFANFDFLTGAYVGLDLEFQNSGSVQIFGGVRRSNVLMAPYELGDSVSSLDDATEMALRPGFGIAISVSPRFIQALPGTLFSSIATATGSEY